jgi:DNA (cytosine-5)-methyltransferase 1
MDSKTLKYPRRSNRTIADQNFKISAPSDSVSKKMQNVKSSDTSIERIVEFFLISNNISYARPKNIIDSVVGKPDFLIPRYQIAIFCDGDFWHGYRFQERRIGNNEKFWAAKIQRNMNRDQVVNTELVNKGWQVFRFWEHEIKSDPQTCIDRIQVTINQKRQLLRPSFTFVDLFSGIGGFRVPLEQLGGNCLGFSEIDKRAIAVYKKNFFEENSNELELGDITSLGKLPFQNIDLIVGGVPCQAWSVAGKMRGFEDPRGKLWHDSIRVVNENKPKAFIFENVKGLIDPRNRANLDLIIKSFEEIGYAVKTPQLLNSSDFGLPQNRERIFIVGVKKSLKSFLKVFEFPHPIGSKPVLADFINGIASYKSPEKKFFEPKDIFGDKIPFSRNKFQTINQLNDFFVFCDTRNGHTTIHSWDIVKTTDREKEICMTVLRNRRKKIYGNSDGNPLPLEVLKKLIDDLKKSELTELCEKKILRYVPSKGYEFVNSKNSSGINGIYRIYLPHSNIFSTLTATGSKDFISLIDVPGSTPAEYRQNFIKQVVKKKAFRQITAKEAGKLQGFPGWFELDEKENYAKKQFGNAVSTTVIYHLAKSLIETGLFNETANDPRRKG